jgi:hypothetical protein
MTIAIQLMALLPVSAAWAQPSPPDGLSVTKAALTGPVARQWVFTRFNVFMGPGVALHEIVRRLFKLFNRLRLHEIHEFAWGPLN